jgi:ATP-dependent DNA ligase
MPPCEARTREFLRPRRDPTSRPRACRHPSPPPAGPDWLHEIKHDGFRILALRDAAGVRLHTRNGHDFRKRYCNASTEN